MAPISATRTPDLQAGTYLVDPQRSAVTYSGRHLFGMGSVHATFAIRRGELRIAEPLTDSTVKVEIDAASFASGNAKRDSDVRSTGLLDVARHPDITFDSRALRMDGDRLLVDGRVTAHGTSVPVEVRVTHLEREADGIRIRADARHLDRYAFGVTGSKGMVGRHLDLTFDVLASPTNP